MTTDRDLLARSAAIASLVVAIVLIALKAWASLRTGSAAMLGSLADSTLDFVASLATLVGVWIGARPADADHRFGHGKAEALAAIVQVVLIGISAIAIAARSVMQMLSGEPTRAAETGIAVSLIAIAATFALLAWQRYVMARTRSLAIATDHLHYTSDLALNLAVIAGLALDQYAGWARADPLFGLVIAAWLGRSAIVAASEAVNDLMDREWPEAKRVAFIEAAARHPELSNLHDLRTRTAGHRDFAQFHVYLPGTMTVAEAHGIIDRVEAELCREFPGTELLIHIDPEGHVDRPDDPMVERNEFARLETE